MAVNECFAYVGDANRSFLLCVLRRSKSEKTVSEKKRKQDEIMVIECVGFAKTYIFFLDNAVKQFSACHQFANLHQNIFLDVFN